MKKTLYKDAVIEIRNTIKRFISILLIVLLGVGFFVGIKATSPDMKKTIDKYFDNQNVFDLQIFSILGFDKSDIEALQSNAYIDSVEGAYNEEASIKVNENEIAVNINSIQTEVNDLKIISGTTIKNPDECLVETRFLKDTDIKIGDKINITEETISGFIKNKEMKVVGTIDSPLYISSTRAYTKLGNGRLEYYIYIPESNINMNAYTVAYIKIEGADSLLCYSDEYDSIINNVKDSLKEVATKRETLRYEKIYNETSEKIENSTNELNKNKEIAKTRFANAKIEISRNEIKLNDNEKLLRISEKNSKVEFKEAYNKIESAYTELEKNEKTFETTKKDALSKLEKAKENLTRLKNLSSSYNSILDNISTKHKRIDKINEEISTLDLVFDIDKILNLTSEKINLNIEIANLNIQKQEMEKQSSENGIDLTNINVLINSTESEIKKSESELKSASDKLLSARKTLDVNYRTLQNKERETNEYIKTAKRNIINARVKLSDSKQELNKKETESNEKIKAAEKEIANAKEKLNDIKKPKWYIMTRSSNTGYNEFISDTDKVANIGKVFPIVFFLVAALISLNSMTRMVEEKRSEIGTMKALGYSNIDIAGKYVIYALLATLIGGVIGMLIGFKLIPNIIIGMYQLMYKISDIILEFNLKYALIGLLVATACTVISTVFSVIKALRSVPASLMIQKAPTPGKRVLLEYIPFIWSKLSFTKKVTARNLFRYKKRFLMTIIGVCGCTALIVAGFGLKDSISYIIPSQYGQIFKYDATITFRDSANSNDIDKKIEEIESRDEVESTLLLNVRTGKTFANNKEIDMQYVIFQTSEDISNYIEFQNRITKQKYKLNDDSVIITEKMAKSLKIKEGDKITIENEDGIKQEAIVSKITENYLLHYVYMTKEMYNKLYQKEINYNTLYINTKDITIDQEQNLGTDILKDNTTISYMAFASSSKNIFEKVMNNMNFITWILIISAGLLDLVVLYNLANVNISERIRELATMKVLGFYDKEVYKYVSRETVILTIIGIILGFIGGIFLNTYIISTCELDMLMFSSTIHLTSFIYATLITVIFTIIVNIVTYFTLKKINMIEALKSVE